MAIKSSAPKTTLRVGTANQAKDESLHLGSCCFDRRYFYSDWTHFINHNSTDSIPPLCVQNYVPVLQQGQFARTFGECVRWERSQVARHWYRKTL